jgi:hypothetical protein
VIGSRQPRPPAGLAACLLTLTLLGAGCTAATPPGTPAVTPDMSTACSPAAGSGATTYPGWPPDADPELVPIIVSTELAVGPNRLLLNLIDSANAPLASPDRPVEFRFFNLAAHAAAPQATVPAAYLPTSADRPGLYRGAVDFPCWGDWGLETVAREADGSERIGRIVFSVRPTATTPQIGADAPASETPTATTADEIGRISTDTEPDPDFYAVSVDQALEQDRPFLLIFATPAFCRTATCGPALDIVKSVAPDFKDRVAFIHVEPYELQVVDGQVQPMLTDDNLPIPVDSVGRWGLPSEPYIFVVDSAGKVTAKLEGVASADEIRDALSEVAIPQ